MVLIKIFDPLYAHMQQQSFHAANFFLESLRKQANKTKQNTPNKLNTDFFLFSSVAKPWKRCEAFQNTLCLIVLFPPRPN